MIRIATATTLVLCLLAGIVRADQLDGILARLESEDPDEQAMAFGDLVRNRHLFQEQKAAERVGLAVGSCLKSKEPIIRFTAVDLLCKLDLPGGRELVPVMWKDPSWMVRSSVVEAMVKFANRAEKPADAVPWITKGLEDPHWSVRSRVAWVVDRELKVFPKALVGPLAKALEARDKKFEKEQPKEFRSLRENVTACLVRAKEHAAPAVKALIDVLEDDSPLVRASAATALGNVGEKAAEAEPALAKLLQDKQAEVRRAAAYALSSFTPTVAATARALGKLLKDKDAKTCVHAATAIGRMGEAASSSVGALVRALGSKDPELRAAAATACGRIGPKAKSALSKLTKMAEKDADEKVRAAAKDALKAIQTE